jgi:hypothetical protein
MPFCDVWHFVAFPAAPICMQICSPNKPVVSAAASCCQAAYGGANCSAAQDELRTVTPCFNNTPCPIDCVGGWGVTGSCSGTCEGGNGTLTETYTVSTPAQWSGQSCPFASGAMRSVLPCTNNAPCPVPCNYTWVQNGNCTGASAARAGPLLTRCPVPWRLQKLLLHWQVVLPNRMRCGRGFGVPKLCLTLTPSSVGAAPYDCAMRSLVSCL